MQSETVCDFWRGIDAYRRSPIFSCRRCVEFGLEDGWKFPTAQSLLAKAVVNSMTARLLMSCQVTRSGNAGMENWRFGV